MASTKKPKETYRRGGGIWKSVNAFADSPVGKLLFQFVIITIGGLVIANAWNTHVAQRQKRAHSELVQEQQYWDDRKAIFALYEKYDLALRRVKNAIDSGSISRIDASVSEFEEALANWQSEQSNYYHTLTEGPVSYNRLCLGVKVTVVRKAQTRECYEPRWQVAAKLDSETAKTIGEKCPRYILFGLGEGRTDENVQINNVYSAFLTARDHIDEVMQSDWATCLRAARSAADFALLDCSQSKELQEFEACLVKANKYKAKSACEPSKDALNAIEALKGDVDRASDSWSIFANAISKQREKVREEAKEKSRYWNRVMSHVPCSIRYWWHDVPGG